MRRAPSPTNALRGTPNTEGPASIGPPPAAATLTAHLRHLTRDAPIAFSRYVELALYHPRWGYYTAPGAPGRTGAAGDFLTAPTTHRFFGAALGRFLAGWCEARGLPKVHLIEAGGGGGELAEPLLEAAGDRVASYTLVERSPAHREAAAGRLAAAGSAVDVRVVAELPREAPGPTLLLANELLDNLPASLLRLRPKPGGATSCEELHVAFGARGAVESFRPPTPEGRAFFDSYLAPHSALRDLEEDTLYPAPLAACRFVRDAARIPGLQGMLLVDYGATTPDLLGSTSARGTVTTHRRHARAGDPYEEPGAHDVTYTVDFDALAWALGEEGWSATGRTTQGRFLVELGAAQEAARLAREPASPERVNELVLLKELFAPDGMGERFKVLFTEPRPAADGPAVRGFGAAAPARR